MGVDQKTLKALSVSLRDLRAVPDGTIPPKTIAALAEIARPGMRLRIDLEASAAIGVPLVTLAAPQSGAQLFANLTKRQRQVAELIVEGRSNRQIADILGISLGTVKDHVHAILQRLELPSRTAVIAAARA
ncbi:LuxR C-terminal-related transcriptional regulator [Yoonia sp. SS1-5]|uniref:LuxR C-terminal-related transcriptional regulator n=1 Tax=Yoonia rhodophyticola TaxID=3137370 RepID=A0AAN0NM85_9RHOB